MTDSPLPPDPYAALGVSKDATLDQIRASYRKLVLKAHPDRFPNAAPEEKQRKADEFHKIQQAYEILSDDSERQKYDAGVRLMQLKSDMLKEREANSARRAGRSPQSSQDYSNIYTFTVPMHEPRVTPIFEDRGPPFSSKKKYDDDYLHGAYDPSGKFDGSYRSSPRARAEEFPRSQPRRSSGRDFYDESRRASEDLEAKREEKARKQAAKEKSRKAHEQDQKTRDKYRRQEAEAKTYSQSPRPDVYTDSDSDGNKYYSPRLSKTSKRRSDEPKKSSTSTRSRRYREDNYSDSDDRDHDQYFQRASTREREAEEYIRAMRGPANSSDPDDSGRRHRRDRMPPTAPSPPPTTSKEKPDATAKRSSARKTRDASRDPRESRSRKDGKPIEIVEPRADARKESRRAATRPNLKPSESAPVNSEAAFKGLNKAATFQPSSQREREPAPPRRSKTSNLEAMANRGRDLTPPPEPSRARRGRTSPVAVDDRNGYAQESPAAKNTRYQVSQDTGDDNTTPGVQTILIEPVGARRPSRSRGERTPASRDVSPHNASSQRRSARARGLPPHGLGISRAQTFQESSRTAEPSSPRFGIQRSSTGIRTNSVGNPDMLFGEYTTEEPVPIKNGRPNVMRSGTNTTFYTVDDISFSPRISHKSVSYSSHPDGGARERMNSDGEDRYMRNRSPRGSDREGGPRRSSRREAPFVTRDGYVGSKGSSRLQKVS